MHSRYILITGITGFLGSHIAESLVDNYNVIGLKRKKSNVWRCENFKDKVIWIDIDTDTDYTNELSKYSLETIIHGAWIGVESQEREDWSVQTKNIYFLLELLQVAKKTATENFIFSLWKKCKLKLKRKLIFFSLDGVGFIFFDLSKLFKFFGEKNNNKKVFKNVILILF